MDEGSEEEERIEQMTGELMKQVGECNRQLAALQRHSGSLRGGQRRVVGNIVTNLVTRMQEIAGDFRTSQGNYLRKVEAREERSSQYFTSLIHQDDEVIYILTVKLELHSVLVLQIDDSLEAK